MISASRVTPFERVRRVHEKTPLLFLKRSRAYHIIVLFATQPFVLSKVGNREAAEDLTAQVFLKAVRGVNPEHSPQARQKWLYQVARTAIADYWRDYYRRRTCSLEELVDAGWDDPAAGESAVDSLVGSDPAERVKRLMQDLPEQYREVFHCRFLLNLSIRETVTRLGLTEANVKVVQFRALKTRRCCRTRGEQKPVTAKAYHFGEEETMAGEDQERLEDYLALERYIEELRAGRVARTPAELTPDLARIYRMAMLFHVASSGAAAPRPDTKLQSNVQLTISCISKRGEGKVVSRFATSYEFIIELQDKLKQEEAIRRAPLKGHRPCSSSKERQAHLCVSRRALLRTGAAVAASLSVGAGIDHALEAQQLAALTAAQPTTPSWLPLVSDDIPTTKHFVTTLDKLGEQPVPFRAGGIVGYLIRNDAERGHPTDGPVIAMSAACTHMGCLVNWESSDLLFRCPCHGGVFSALGKMVTTPSTIRYLAPLPRLETIIDPAGNIFVRVPSQTSSIP